MSRAAARASAPGHAQAGTGHGGGGIEVCDLHVRYGERHAVRGISFAVGAGQTLAIVGESGCGKTSAALAIARLLPAGSTIQGRVSVDGFDLAGAGGSQLRDARGRLVAYMPQDAMAALNPVQSAGRQIAEVLRHRHGAGRREASAGAVALLAQVGIADPASVARRYAHELSGGMRQRVMLAIALAGRPRVLVADEPTTALDVTVQAGILALVQRLTAKERMALVWITHDIGVVAEIADAVAVMYGGLIVEQGPAETIFERPAHPYTQALVGAPRASRLALPKEPFEAIPGAPPLGEFPAGCPFHTRCARGLERCAQRLPGTRTLGQGHGVACHLVEEPETLG